MRMMSENEPKKVVYRLRRTFYGFPMGSWIGCDLKDMAVAELSANLHLGESVTIDAVEMTSEQYRAIPELPRWIEEK